MNNVAASPEFLAAVDILLGKTYAIGLAMIPVFLMIVVFNQVFAALVFSQRFRLRCAASCARLRDLICTDLLY